MSGIFLVSVLYATWGAFSSRTNPAIAAVAFAIILLAYQVGARP